MPEKHSPYQRENQVVVVVVAAAAAALVVVVVLYTRSTRRKNCLKAPHTSLGLDGSRATEAAKHSFEACGGLNPA